MPRQFVRLGRIGAAGWGERPVAIVGGGPSLKGFDVERLRRFTVLAVNGSIFDIPWADHGFSLDRRAMRAWWPKLRTLKIPVTFAVPDCWLVNFASPPTPNMGFVRRVKGTVFHPSGERISGGGTSGYGALQLAWLKGARRIVLFGFDCRQTAGAWHADERHYSFPQAQDPAKWAEWAANFDDAAWYLNRDGVEVINASPESAIAAFPKCTVEQGLRL